MCGRVSSSSWVGRTCSSISDGLRLSAELSFAEGIVLGPGRWRRLFYEIGALVGMGRRRDAVRNQRIGGDISTASPLYILLLYMLPHVAKGGEANLML